MGTFLLWLLGLLGGFCTVDSSVIVILRVIVFCKHAFYYRMWRLLATLVLALAAHSTLALRCLTPEDDSTRNPTARRELLRSQLDFSLNLLKAVGKEEPTENVFISPLSIYNALLQAYFVSAGHTEKSLHDALFLPKNVVSN